MKRAVLKVFALMSACAVTVSGIWLYSGIAERMKPVAEYAARLSAGGSSVSYTLPDNGDNSYIPEIGYSWDKSAPDTPVQEHRESVNEGTKPEKTSCEFPSPKPSESVLNAIPYSNGTSEDGPIVPYFFTGYTDDCYFTLDNGGQVKNCTDIPNSVLYEESSKPCDFKAVKTSDEPQVLIYHTHATESFELEEKSSYDRSFSCKTTERDKSIVSVGDRICDELDKAGIGYVHDTLIHDYPSYDDAYDSSRESIRAILDKYPSIKIVLDIHRDGIQREDGTRLTPTVEINNRKAAQIMIISGCDDGTMGMPGYIENFHFACALQSALESDWEGLTRPILFDYRHYNQDLTNGSLLIEIGAQANTLAEAQYSGTLVGKTLARII